MKSTYKPEGVCAQLIDLELDDDGIIMEITFTGGCPGNSQGLVTMCKGLTATEIIKKLKGIHCGRKATSCPDQLTIALERHLAE